MEGSTGSHSEGGIQHERRPVETEGLQFVRGKEKGEATTSFNNSNNSNSSSSKDELDEGADHRPYKTQQQAQTTRKKQAASNNKDRLTEQHR